jgi:non-specific serine/threonine protein kinase
MEPVRRLPAQLTSFIGQENEVRGVGAALRASRLVTLTGPPGIGKTRLALQIAEGPAHDLAEEVFFVDLAPVRDPVLLPAAIASAVGADEDRGLPLVATLAARLDGRRGLLVLDNCEHLVDATAAFVDELLRSSGDTRVLATSREPLGVAGETVWSVAPLTVFEAADPTARQLAEVDSARLFCDRARQASRSFTLTDDNAPAVATVCRRMDGIPLGIELAAALVRVLAVDEIAERLDLGLPLPRSPERSRPDRHQTVQGAIAWSYNLLSGAERVTLGRLSVFPGLFGADAAGHVCGDVGADAPETLARLVEKSLVVRVHDGGQVARYRLLDMVRAFSAVRLDEADDARAARDLHLEYFARLGEVISAGYESGDPDAEVQFSDELDSFRAALAWARESEPPAGLRLAGAIFRFLAGGIHAAEGRRWLEAFLADVRESPWRLRALCALSDIACAQGDYETSVETAEQALAISWGLGRPDWTALVLLVVAQALRASGQVERARAAGDEATALALDSGDEATLATVLVREGRGASIEAAIDLCRRLDRTRDLALALRRSAQAHLGSGDLVAARAAAVEVLSVTAMLQWTVAGAGALLAVGHVASAAGDDARALRLAGAASRQFDAMGFSLPPADRAAVEAWVAESRARVGKRANDLWAEGWALSIDEAIDYATATDPAPTPSGRRRSPLTKREMEVAVRVARGLTSRRIAEELVVSERTIDAHVEHIRTKLGLRSRAQIAAWVTEERLTSSA